MRKSIFATFTAAVAVAAALLLTGCERAIDMTGKPVSFAAGISDGASGLKSRVAYGAVESNYQALDWQEGDHITIYCEACEDKKIAMYEVQDIEKASDADMHSYAGLVNAESDGAGLRWGIGEHTFYAVYPSPEEDRNVTIGIGPYSDGGTRSSVAKSISNNIVTAAIPSRQKVIGSVTESGGIWTATPDLTNMLMTAKSTYSAETGIPDGSVFLDFKPLTTVLEFTIKKEDSDSVMDISSVSLTSEGHALSGRFKVDMDVIGKYTTTGTWCTEGSGRPETTLASATPSEADRKVTINFGSPVKLAKEQSLTFTFFLNPGNDVDDLTFSISGTVGKDGETKESFNRKTALKKSDGTGVAFPTHQKTRISGLMLPDAIGWTVNYGPTVDPWNASGTDIDPMPEVSIASFVTSWDTENGIDDELTLEPKGKSDLLPGKFSVSANDYVQFSCGNLQATYHSSGSYTWAIARNQYDYVGNAAGNTTIGGQSDGAVVDLFGWTAAGKYNDGIQQYGINVSQTYSDYYKDEEDKCCNWEETVGGNGVLSVLSNEDWKYLVNTRKIKRSGISDAASGFGNTCQWVKYNGVFGILIYPDEYDGTKYDTYAEIGLADFPSDCVFLPAAGIRNGSSMSDVTSGGRYWSNTVVSTDHAYSFDFTWSGTSSAMNRNRYAGQSVRLVQRFKKHHDAVLIGGRYWATMNVGATTVAGDPSTCYGDWFAWGETEPYYSSVTISNATTVTFNSWKSGKDNGYAWSSYRYCTGAENTLTKYNDDSNWGNVDNKTSLEPKDDAATAKWGGTWRTPTMDDFIALCEDCGCTFVNNEAVLTTGGTSSTTEKGVYWCDNYDGVPGVLFSNGTDKVFFPATGRCDGTTNGDTYAGNLIRYWSSKVYKKGEPNGGGGDAWGIFSKDGKLKYDGFGSRYQGRAIRPVHD